MRTRSTRGSDTKLRIIQIAADLFHKQGVAATSPDKIIDASGTGKGQFYYYFKNKEGLVHEVLQHYLDGIKTGASPIHYEIESWQDLETWFLAHVELQKAFRMTRGCPFGTIGNEVTENDELIRQDLSLIFELVRAKLAAFFIREKAKGRISKRVDEGQLADYCIAVAQGAMLMGKVKRDSRIVEAAMKEALSHLKAYVAKPRARKPN